VLYDSAEDRALVDTEMDLIAERSAALRDETRDEAHRKEYEVIRKGALLYKNAFREMAAFDDQKRVVEEQLEEAGADLVVTLERLLGNQREDFAALIATNAPNAALEDKEEKQEKLTGILTSLLNAQISAIWGCFLH